MNKTTWSELSKCLRELADELAELSEDIECRVRVSFHSKGKSVISSLDHLRSVANITSDLSAAQSLGHHWVSGHFGPIEIIAHYLPGLLGQTRVERFVERDAEVVTDLSLLKAEPCDTKS